MTALEQLLRRLIREEIEAHEARRAAGEAATAAIGDDVERRAADRAAKLRTARSKRRAGGV